MAINDGSSWPGAYSFAQPTLIASALSAVIAVLGSAGVGIPGELGVDAGREKHLVRQATPMNDAAQRRWRHAPAEMRHFIALLYAVIQVNCPHSTKIDPHTIIDKVYYQ